MSDAFSAALLVQAGVQKQLTFWSSTRNQRIPARCWMVYDGADSSFLFLGASMLTDILSVPVASQASELLAPPGSCSSEDTKGSGESKKPLPLVAVSRPVEDFFMDDMSPCGPMASGLFGQLPRESAWRMDDAVGSYSGQASAQATPAGAACSGNYSVRPSRFPMQLVLHLDDGQEQWRSSVQLLDGRVRAQELFTPGRICAFGMPRHLVDFVVQETFHLYVQEARGELLQIADLDGTTILRLQPHCDVDGLLTLVIAPQDDSEDAFEAVPRTSGAWNTL